MTEEQQKPTPLELALALRLRWQIDPGIKVTVQLAGTEALPDVTALFEVPSRAKTGPDAYRLRVGFERWRAPKEGDREPLTATIQALDALVGSLVESGFGYRELPQGAGVEHEEGSFSVEVERTKPDLERWADDLLSRN
ncbi:MAG: hypothetical protein HY791_27770 [Deltaproteobacteria bacterium]|nr:hypothetical protein [Deltaproteobacteria bacterium]